VVRFAFCAKPGRQSDWAKAISQNAMIFGKPVQSFAVSDGMRPGLLALSFIYRQEIKGCSAKNAARLRDGKLAAEMP